MKFRGSILNCLIIDICIICARGIQERERCVYKVEVRAVVEGDWVFTSRPQCESFKGDYRDDNLPCVSLEFALYTAARTTRRRIFPGKFLPLSPCCLPPPSFPLHFILRISCVLELRHPRALA